MRKIIIGLIIVLMMAQAGSASIIDDLGTLNNRVNEGISGLLSNVKSLSLPSYGSVTVKCDSGATCGQEGENWLVTMNTGTNVGSAAQTLILELPSGTKAISGDVEVTTQGTVDIEVNSKQPVQTIPVSQSTTCNTRDGNCRYALRIGGTYQYLPIIYDVPAYERSSLGSIITTNYDIQLIAPKGNSPVKSVSYNYLTPQTIRLYDGAGNMATITPSHQNNGGFIADTASVVYVDNGYGTLEIFDKTSFGTYLAKANDEIRWSVTPWSLPNTWAGVLSRMKALGLRQFTDIPARKDGNNIVLTYPTGSIGTSLQAVIPKPMAVTLSVRQHWGEPSIDSVDLSPNPIKIGQGQVTLTVKVTNRGTTDNIGVAAIVNGATVNNIVSSMTLATGRQGTYTFSLNPTVSDPAQISVRVVATAGGSGLVEERSVILDIQAASDECPWYNPLCRNTNQRVIVTAYNPEGSILTTAPIFKNLQQVGTGKWEGDLPLGKYSFSTNNESNPGLFAPTAAEIELTGGEPKHVSLVFAAKPSTDNDMTWLFWLVIGFIVLVIAYFTRWYRLPTFWIGIVLLFVMYKIYEAITGLSNDLQNTWTSITTLGGILK